MQKYLTLQQAIERHNSSREQCYVDIIAVVAEWDGPKRGRGSDYVSKLSLVDESIVGRDLVVEVIMFSKFSSHLPGMKQSGDIICLRSVKVQAHNGKLQFFGKLESPSTFCYSVFHHKNGPGVQLDTPYLNPEKTFYPSEHEVRILAHLRDFSAKRPWDVAPHVPPSFTRGGAPRQAPVSFSGAGALGSGNLTSLQGGNSQLDVDANASQLALPPQASQALQAHPLLPVDTGFEPSIEYLKANGVYESPVNGVACLNGLIVPTLANIAQSWNVMITCLRETCKEAWNSKDGKASLLMRFDLSSSELRSRVVIQVGEHKFPEKSPGNFANNLLFTWCALETRDEGQNWKPDVMLWQKLLPTSKDGDEAFKVFKNLRDAHRKRMQRALKGTEHSLHIEEIPETAQPSVDETGLSPPRVDETDVSCLRRQWRQTLAAAPKNNKKITLEPYFVKRVTEMLDKLVDNSVHEDDDEEATQTDSELNEVPNKGKRGTGRRLGQLDRRTSRKRGITASPGSSAVVEDDDTPIGYMRGGKRLQQRTAPIAVGVLNGIPVWSGRSGSVYEKTPSELCDSVSVPVKVPRKVSQITAIRNLNSLKQHPRVLSPVEEEEVGRQERFPEWHRWIEENKEDVNHSHGRSECNDYWVSFFETHPDPKAVGEDLKRLLYKGMKGWLTNHLVWDAMREYVEQSRHICGNNGIPRFALYEGGEVRKALKVDRFLEHDVVFSLLNTVEVGNSGMHWMLGVTKKEFTTGEYKNYLLDPMAHLGVSYRHRPLDAILSHMPVQFRQAEWSRTPFKELFGVDSKECIQKDGWRCGDWSAMLVEDVIKLISEEDGYRFQIENFNESRADGVRSLIAFLNSRVEPAPVGPVGAAAGAAVLGSQEYCKMMPTQFRVAVQEALASANALLGLDEKPEEAPQQADWGEVNVAFQEPRCASKIVSGSKVSAHMDLLSQTWVRPEKTLPMQKTVDWNSEPMRKWFKTKGYAVYDMAEIDEEFKNLLLQLCAAEKNFVSDEGSRFTNWLIEKDLETAVFDAFDNPPPGVNLSSLSVSKNRFMTSLKKLEINGDKCVPPESNKQVQEITDIAKKLVERVIAVLQAPDSLPASDHLPLPSSVTARDVSFLYFDPASTVPGGQCIHSDQSIHAVDKGRRAIIICTNRTNLTLHEGSGTKVKNIQGLILDLSVKAEKMRNAFKNSNSTTASQSAIDSQLRCQQKAVDEYSQDVTILQAHIESITSMPSNLQLDYGHVCIMSDNLLHGGGPGVVGPDGKLLPALRIHAYMENGSKGDKSQFSYPSHRLFQPSHLDRQWPKTCEKYEKAMKKPLEDLALYLSTAIPHAFPNRE